VIRCTARLKHLIKHPKLQTTKYLLSLPEKQLRILVSLITGHCCLNKHLHRMGLATSPVCASCQLEEETALHFVCVCPTLATLRTRIFGRPIINASEFTDVSASAILRFAFQSGRLETNRWHNSLKCVRRLLIYNVLFFYSLHFSPRGAHWAQTETSVQEFCFYQEWLYPF
jgi:hypothetical protein